MKVRIGSQHCIKTVISDIGPIQRFKITHIHIP